MDSDRLVQVVNSILGLSKEKKKDLIKLLINICDSIRNIEKSDWNENDENKQSFVKNRTHYSYYDGEENVTTPLQNIGWSKVIENNELFINIYDDNQNFLVKKKASSLGIKCNLMNENNSQYSWEMLSYNENFDDLRYAFSSNNNVYTITNVNGINYSNLFTQSNKKVVSIEYSRPKEIIKELDKKYIQSSLDDVINRIVGEAPEAYDTLKEISDALSDNGVVGQILTAISQKLDASDYIQTDWNQNDNTKKDYIKNRTHYSEENIQLETIVLTGDTNILTYTETNGNIEIFNDGEKLPFKGRISNYGVGTYKFIDDAVKIDNNLSNYSNWGDKIILVFKSNNNIYTKEFPALLVNGYLKTNLASILNNTTSNSMNSAPSDGYLYGIKGYTDRIINHKIDKKYLPYDIDSIIQRIEELESKVQQLETYHQ